MFTKTTLSIAALAVAFSTVQPIASASAEGLHISPEILASEPVLNPGIVATPPVFTGPVVEVGPVIPTNPILPNPISCQAAKKLVKNAGYKKVKKVECDGTVFTFKGKKNGQKMVVAINAITKQIWTV